MSYPVLIENQEILQISKEISLLKQEGTSIVITDDISYENAGTMLKRVKDRKKDVEALEKKLRTPFNDALSTLSELFRPSKDAIKTAIDKIDMGMANYRETEAKRRAEAAAKIKAEQDRVAKEMEEKAKDAEFLGDCVTAQVMRNQAVVMTAAPAAVGTTPKVKGMGVRKFWKFQIVDPTAIPREFLCPDEKKIGEYIRANEDKAVMSGVKFYYEERLV
jgi:hypothetical protein